MDNYILQCNDIINKNIKAGLLLNDRGFMSQNILGQLRNLIDHICVKIFIADGGKKAEKEYDNIKNATAYVKRGNSLNFLGRFHEFLLISASHYSFDGDSSERLMLKYYEYLLRTKNYMKDRFGMDLLEDLDKFPLDTDPALKVYHEAIASRIDSLNLASVSTREYRFCIEKIKPLFVNGRIYYEVTFIPANDRVSKFDRIIAFTALELPSFYAIYLRLVSTTIEIDGMVMPVNIIVDSRLAVRMCELRNFSKIFGSPIPVSKTKEYSNLMNFLHTSRMSLTDVMDFPDGDYDDFVREIGHDAKSDNISAMLGKARNVIKNGLPGANVLRYLLLRLNNRLIKRQLHSEPRWIMGDLCLKPQCKPFDKLPFAFSLVEHNPRFSDLIASIPPAGHEGELLARRLRENAEQEGRLFTPLGELSMFGDASQLESLADEFNRSLHPKHVGARIELFKGHYYIHEYEENVCKVLGALKKLSAGGGVVNYTKTVDSWLASPGTDTRARSREKELKSLFANSKLALIYGAAGTGKSTFINFISNIFDSNSKLYLANTNPAVDNLQRKVDASGTTFMTISRFLAGNGVGRHYDILFVDECSTVSNMDMCELLECADFSLLVLVGDTYQIESIRFGNWFDIAYQAFRKPVRVELEDVYRTTDTSLLNVWTRVRTLSTEIVEYLAKGNCSARLDNSIFVPSDDDEIILSLNYDGLYGINNVNRFLQNNNPNPAVGWDVHTYKVGDPVLFNESSRFAPWLYNNLKGRIIAIDVEGDNIYFKVEVNTVLNSIDLEYSEIELFESANPTTSIVRFRVGRPVDNDDDDDAVDSIVPFQIAYAVSIHKAQGLEYRSVKVVITREVEEQITHNILYTAITRACEKLKIYWSPETQKNVISSLHLRSNGKDYGLLRAMHPDLF